jgi:hypothetical protein
MNGNIERLLIAAKNKIRYRKNWTTRWFARTPEGASTGPLQPEACSFCAIGAIQAVGPSANDEFEARGYLSRALRVISGSSWPQEVSVYNDTHTHAEVLALYRKAIILANKEGA